MIAASAFAQQKGFRYRIAEGRSPLVMDPHAAFIFNFFKPFRLGGQLTNILSTLESVEARAGMEKCCRSCMPCLKTLWIAYGPEFFYRAWFDRPRSARFRVIIRVPAPKKKPTQLYAALFDFEARSEEEMTVKEGDKLSVMRRGEIMYLPRSWRGPWSPDWSLLIMWP